MLDINFQRDGTYNPSWVAKFQVSSGDEVTIYISHFSNEGEGWTVHIDMQSPNCKSHYGSATSLSRSCERSTIADCFEYNNVQVTSQELDTVTKKTIEIVEKTRPRSSAHDSYFGI